jgi:hypothetical protein
MGYRSEVAYVIRFADKEKLDTFIGVQLVKKDEHITQALKELTQIETTEEQQFLFFHADDVKWYDDYPDVKVHHNFMHDAVDMFEDCAWVFLRCGEQYDDVQEESDGDDAWDLCDFISIQRPSINYDIGNTKPILTEEGELV